MTKEIYQASQARIADLEKSETTLRADVECFKASEQLALCFLRFLAVDDRSRAEPSRILATRRKATLNGGERAEGLCAGHSCIYGPPSYHWFAVFPFPLTSLHLARLHFELLHLKLAETDANENLTVANNRIRTLETRLLRSEERFDAKERALQHSRTEFTYQVSRMRTTITVSHQTNVLLTHSLLSVAAHSIQWVASAPRNGEISRPDGQT